ncbi:hypothetical protein D049_3918A, partial [Vibrio parahaemolyticus VPTS-2010]|jgi:hypothetical protein
MFINK